MIAPNMATMLAFYTTDAAVSPALLEKALKTVPGDQRSASGCPARPVRSILRERRLSPLAQGGHRVLAEYASI